MHPDGDEPTEPIDGRVGHLAKAADRVGAVVVGEAVDSSRDAREAGARGACVGAPLAPDVKGPRRRKPARVVHEKGCRRRVAHGRRQGRSAGRLGEQGSRQTLVDKLLPTEGDGLVGGRRKAGLAVAVLLAGRAVADGQGIAHRVGRRSHRDGAGDRSHDPLGEEVGNALHLRASHQAVALLEQVAPHQAPSVESVNSTTAVRW